MADSIIKAEVNQAAKGLLKNDVICTQILSAVLDESHAIDMEQPGADLKSNNDYQQTVEHLVSVITQQLTGKNPDNIHPDEWRREWERALGEMRNHPIMTQHVPLNPAYDPFQDVYCAVKGILNKELSEATQLIWDISVAMSLIGARDALEGEVDSQRINDIHQKIKHVYDAVLY